ncbi:MAG: hypothetical protein ACTS4Y_01245 [Candidatus Hodgkinia cicadicola]
MLSKQTYNIAQSLSPIMNNKLIKINITKMINLNKVKRKWIKEKQLNVNSLRNTVKLH